MSLKRCIIHQNKLQDPSAWSPLSIWSHKLLSKNPRWNMYALYNFQFHTSLQHFHLISRIILTVFQIFSSKPWSELKKTVLICYQANYGNRAFIRYNQKWTSNCYNSRILAYHFIIAIGIWWYYLRAWFL